MKSEDQILELLAELLRKQDQMQETLQIVNNRIGKVEDKVSKIEDKVSKVEDKVSKIEDKVSKVEGHQQAHQVILRQLVTRQEDYQRKNQRILASHTELLDSIARMQRNQNSRLDRLENPSDFV